MEGSPCRGIAKDQSIKDNRQDLKLEVMLLKIAFVPEKYPYPSHSLNPSPSRNLGLAPYFPVLKMFGLWNRLPPWDFH